VKRTANATAAPAGPVCHTALDGEPCTEKIEWVRSQGIFDNPEWYPGLGFSSGYEAFQDNLHSKPETKDMCPKPCPCHTAAPGEACYDKVVWAMKDGIISHPEWYKPLTKFSRFEEFQQHLFETKDKQALCKQPCRAPRWGTPSLFCWMKVTLASYELGLVRAQVNKGAGIFACEDFLVVADGKLDLGIGVPTAEVPAMAVGVSKDGTAANTLIFMKAWEKVGEDFRWRMHDFILKADPDCVVLASRVREKLRPITGQRVYVKNCGKGTGPGWPMMFGSLEAFSRAAMEAYFAGAHRCATELQWQAWGEDIYMEFCFDHLGVGSAVDLTISGDNVCTGAVCSDGVHAAYHPYKDEGSWFACWNQAKR